MDELQGQCVKRSEVLKIIQSHQQQLRALGVQSFKLFGSVARDEATAESDVDILVELEESIGFFEFFKIKNYIEELLQCPVDMGTEDALKEHLREPILEEMLSVF